MNLEQRCRPIELILSDVDGVLTDGSIIYDNNGVETKHFNARDGQGINMWRRAGYQFGIVTLRCSKLVERRCADFNVTLIRQGFEDKLPAARELAAEIGLGDEQLCYLGDDLPDLPVVRAAGLGVAVADAADELVDAADYVTRLPGGRGAVREVIQMILKAKGQWAELVGRYDRQAD